MRIHFFVAIAAALMGQQVADSQQPVPTLPETVVEMPRPNVVIAPAETAAPAAGTTDPFSRSASLIGQAASASQGIYGQADLSTRAIFSPNNLLDPIPGFASTQENTGNDANVYYIRGVNAEHGTDFALFVDDMAINMPTQAHAQGQANLQFMIPELVEAVEYRKGSYYADLGDFSTLGAAKFSIFRILPQSIDHFGVGQYAWVRGLTASTVTQWNGDLTYAADLSYYDNGFDTPERNKRFKGLLKHTLGDEIEGLSTSLMAYHGDWFSTDPQPVTSLRTNGLYSNLDPTTGGRESRFSWNTQYWREDDLGAWKANAYAIYNRFDLYINPEQEPDGQVLQPDGRLITGLNIARRLDWYPGDRESPWTAGVQLRNDFIPILRRDNTIDRVFVSSENSHRVNIFTVSPYLQNETHWTDWMRTIVGVRSDLYQFDVTNRLDPASGSGSTSAGPVTPKLSLILGPWTDTEYYANFGTGFHSNDARFLFDPTEPTDPIARTQSAEVGLRSQAIEGWMTDVAVWQQEFDSELVYNAEEGETEALGPSRRYGVEFNNRFFLTPSLTWDVDWAWAHVRFKNGDRVPQSLSSLFKTGPTLQNENGLYGSLWFTAFSPRPLTEDGSVFSRSMEVGNLQLGWRSYEWQIAADVFNVFGSRDFQQTFFEGGDFLALPLAPTQARFSLTRYY